MVKVAENKVIDLDIFPGNKQGDKLAQQTRDAVQGKLPPDEAQGILANAQGMVGAVGGTVGGSLKGIFDTAGNTVGVVAQGLQGTVQGIGDGLGSTVQFAGGAVGVGVSQVGTYITGSKGEGQVEATSGTNPDTASASLSDEAENSGDRRSANEVERRVLPDEYKSANEMSGTTSSSSSEVQKNT